MIKAIIFDIGGVILRTEDRHPRQQLEARLGLAAGEAETIVFNSAIGQKAQQGQITTAELWAWVQQHLSLKDGELARFQEEFWAGDRIDWSLVELIDGLHLHYRTAIISNASDNLNEIVARFDPLGQRFDLVIGSAYEKIMKPNAEIFTRTLARLQISPAEAVFIDDFAHNILAAQTIGMHTIHFQPTTDLRHQLQQLGVTC